MTAYDIQTRIDNGDEYIELGAAKIDVDTPLIVPAGRPPVTFRGVGMDATQIRAGAGFIQSDGVTVRLHNLSITSQARHVGVAVDLSGSGADLMATGCRFQGLYDALWADWAGGMLNVQNCEFRDILRRAIIGQSGPGFWVARISGSYFDGRESDGLITLCGIHAGGLITNNYMQASRCHLDIDAYAQGPVNELVISNNMLDQDSESDAVLRIHGDGVAVGGSSNCIKFAGNYINTTSCAVDMVGPANVDIEANKIRWSGAGAAIRTGYDTKNQAQSADVAIITNKLQYFGSAKTSAIHLASGTGFRVKGNYGRSFGATIPFITLDGDYTDASITENSPGMGYSRLVNGDMASGPGELIVRNNTPYHSPYAQATVDGMKMTLPVVDESQVVAVGPVVGQIELIVGVTARQGVRVTLISASLVRFRQPASMIDGSVGVDFDLEPFRPKTLVKFQGNDWYPL